MTNRDCILGMDVGGTFIRAGIVDRQNEIVCERIVETASVMGAADSCMPLVEWTAELIRSGGRPVSAVSVGLPAVLNKERTRVMSAPNVKGLDNQPIVDLFEKNLGIRTFIEKDACLLLYHDLYVNRVPREGILIGLYIGTGIGNAVIIDGKPFVGKNGAACEIGHIPCMGRSDICSCGNEGCMEIYASGRALEAFGAENFPETCIRDLFTCHGDDRRMEQMIERFAIPIATEINIFDPDCVVLGGGVLAMKDFPRKKLEDKIIKYTRKPVPAETLSIIYARPSQHNGILGAALYARSRMEDEDENCFGKRSCGAGIKAANQGLSDRTGA